MIIAEQKDELIKLISEFSDWSVRVAFSASYDGAPDERICKKRDKAKVKMEQFIKNL